MPSGNLERLAISVDSRFLTTESGQPFFWLGDTAWELFHRLNRQDAEHYLETRRQQGFNLIQAVILAEQDGLHTPNTNGHVPLCGDDPARPNEPYFQYVDEIIRLAASKGLYIGLLPTWGDKVNALWGIGPVVFDTGNARIYGEFLGQRYRDDTNLVWILGGDRPAQGYEAIWNAMAEGILAGLGRKSVFSYHPMGGHSSSEWFHHSQWLGINMWQSGHVLLDSPNWEMITSDYWRTPVKPVLDGEPNYEDHPVDPYQRKWQVSFGRFNDYDVRKQAYRAVFSGACGHTYGHHSVWQFWTLDRQPINFPMPTWEEAILRPGAAQLVHLKNLLRSRPYLTRIPDQSLLVDEPSSPPADANERYHPLRACHPRATRDTEGRFAFVYIPQAEQTVKIDLRKLAGDVRAWWYDPRNGNSFTIGDYANREITAFTTPFAGPDWVLVLDTNQARFPAPGRYHNQEGS
jgi:hypothetical protein